MLTDGELLKRYTREGDETAFAEVVRRHGQMVAAVARRLAGTDADDVAQAVFIVLARKAKRLGGQRDVSSWLHRTCQLATRNAARVRARRRAHEEEAATMKVTQRDTRLSPAARASLCKNLDASLVRLPERFRTPVILCHLEGLSQVEAARRLGVPPGTVASRVKSGLEELRARLERPGLTLGTAALGSFLSESSGEAAASFCTKSILGSVTSAAKASAASAAAADGVGLIVEKTMKTMFWAKAKSLGAIVAGAAVLVAGTSLALRAVSGEPAASAPIKAPKLPAFPGAEGFGAVSAGGRGGQVIKVTNLNADGPGSLTAACAAKGPRIVVFEVSGVIPVKGKGKRNCLYIKDSNITIAGQTAPGAGITVAGELSTKPYYSKIFAAGKKGTSTEGLRAHDLTIRFMRFRPSEQGAHHSVGLAGAERFILDHVSGSWGVDENMDFSTSRQFTVQWCGVDESGWVGPLSKYRIGKSQQFKAGGNNPHCYGMIMGYTDKGNVSLHHNLFAHHNRRAPLCGLEVLDHRNNVIYNVAAGIMFHSGKRKNKDRPGKLFRTNIIGNYFKHGPSAPAEFKDALPENKAGGYGTGMVGEAGAEAYARGNYLGAVGKVVDAWSPGHRRISMKKCIKVEKPWPAPPVTTHKAEEAYELVLAHSGCLPHDVVSKRMIKDTREGTGEWGRHDPKDLMEGLTPGKAPKDSDNDGLPDAWEKVHKLNPADPKDGNKVVPAGASKDDRHKGYTYIEYYINELADKLIEKAKADYQEAKTK